MRMLTVMVAVCCISLAACAEEPSSPSQWGDDVDRRVLAQYVQYGERHILLIGDSLTAQSPLAELCGWPVIRAGYSGGKWAAVAERPIWSQIKSRFIVVQLGTNNALKGPSIDQSEMHAFLDRLHAWHLVVETIPPFFDPAYATPEHLHFLEEIQANTLALGYQAIDSRQVMADPALYVDGIHWNDRGYAAQTALLEEAVCPWGLA